MAIGNVPVVNVDESTARTPYELQLLSAKCMFRFMPKSEAEYRELIIKKFSDIRYAAQGRRPQFTGGFTLDEADLAAFEECLKELEEIVRTVGVSLDSKVRRATIGSIMAPARALDPTFQGVLRKGTRRRRQAKKS